MKDNNIHNKDIFGESIKSKLENYQMPLDESVWIGIEKQLAPKQSRILPFWFWLSGGVAASFLVIFLLNPFKTTNVEFATKKTEKTKISAQTTPKALHQQTNSLSESKIQKKSTISIKSKSNIASNISKTYSDKTSSDLEKENSNLQINRNEPQDINFTDNVSNTEFQAKEVNKGLANSVLQVKDSIPAKITEPKLTSLPEIPEILELPEENPKKKQKNDWLLAANLGTSGNTDFNFSNGDMYADIPQMTASEAYGDGLKQYASAANAYILQPSDYDNVEHLNPVSVGFSIQKSLTPNLSVSSGLVYTYLRSNYSLDNQWQQADASLDLHYVGVPLNLNVMIAEKKHWNYYFSIGAMIEKGLRSVYKQTIQYGSSSTHHTNVYSKIDGVQTSADAAFGVGYKLQKNWSLFFEPKLTYYFKNNQPMSARTETPLNVGFNGGMKVGF